MGELRVPAPPPALAELSSWSWPDAGLRRRRWSGVERLRAWRPHRRGEIHPPWTGRAWAVENAEQEYGVIVSGDARAPDPARAALARQVCVRMPELAAKLLDWLADRPGLPNGAPHRWELDHLSFMDEPGKPPTGFMLEVHDSNDPREPGESGLQVACGWRLERPRDPLVVFGLRWHNHPWPPEFDTAEPVRERHGFLEFLRDGRLAGVARGDTRAEVERRWGPPVERTEAGWDGWGPVPSVAWRGECSVMADFDAEGRVERLTVDLERHPSDTREIRIAPGVVLDLEGFPPGLDDDDVEARLREHVLAYERRAEGERWDDQHVEWTLLASGVTLGAWNTDCASGLCEAALEDPVPAHDAPQGRDG